MKSVSSYKTLFILQKRNHCYIIETRSKFNKRIFFRIFRINLNTITLNIMITIEMKNN